MHSTTLIHITPDAEQLIAYMARVSNPANQNNTETSDRLIRYLIKHKHWSPFEMVNMCVQIKTTRSIAAQILRHRSFSFQEFSQRYSSVTDIGSPVVPHLRRQDMKNRQNSTDDLNAEVTSKFYRRISSLFEDAEHLYQEMLSAGVAKECARDILPLASPTRLYMNGTIRSWIHFCQLRCADGTQKEHQKIAQQAKQLLVSNLPNVAKALEWVV